MALAADSGRAGIRAGDVADFDEFDFTHERKARRVLRRGAGPGVLLMHELPGMTPECLHLGGRIADAGFAVYLPLLFGRPGERAGLRSMLGFCVSREVGLLAANGPSPVTGWLRALCRHIHAQCLGPGIGVVGMCMTGGFVLSAMLEPAVLAAVASQPSLPLAAWTPARQRALGIPAHEVAQAARRARDDGIDLLGLRFSEDRLCPRRRFDALRSAFGSRFAAIEIASGAGNPWGIDRSAHSVLTGWLVDEHGQPTHDALETTLRFLRDRLQTGGADSPSPAAPSQREV